VGIARADARNELIDIDELEKEMHNRSDSQDSR